MADILKPQDRSLSDLLYNATLPPPAPAIDPDIEAWNAQQGTGAGAGAPPSPNLLHPQTPSYVPPIPITPAPNERSSFGPLAYMQDKSAEAEAIQNKQYPTWTPPQRPSERLYEQQQQQGGGAYSPGGMLKASETSSWSYTKLPKDVSKELATTPERIREAMLKQQQAADEIGEARKNAALDKAFVIGAAELQGEFDSADHKEKMNKIGEAILNQEKAYKEAVANANTSFMDQAGAGYKTLTGIGLLAASLAKIGSLGRVGQRRPENRMFEFAMQQIDNAIEQDFRRKNANKEAQKSVYDILIQKGATEQEAYKLAQADAYNKMRMGIDRIEATLQADTSKAMAQQISGELLEREAKARQDAAVERGRLEGKQISGTVQKVAQVGPQQGSAAKTKVTLEDSKKLLLGAEGGLGLIQRFNKAGGFLATAGGLTEHWPSSEAKLYEERRTADGMLFAKSELGGNLSNDEGRAFANRLPKNNDTRKHAAEKFRELVLNKTISQRDILLQQATGPDAAKIQPQIEKLNGIINQMNREISYLEQ